MSEITQQKVSNAITAVDVFCTLNKVESYGTGVSIIGFGLELQQRFNYCTKKEKMESYKAWGQAFSDTALDATFDYGVKAAAGSVSAPAAAFYIAATAIVKAGYMDAHPDAYPPSSVEAWNWVREENVDNWNSFVESTQNAELNSWEEIAENIDPSIWPSGDSPADALFNTMKELYQEASDYSGNLLADLDEMMEGSSEIEDALGGSYGGIIKAALDAGFDFFGLLAEMDSSGYPEVSDEVSSLFNTFTRFPQRSDPFTLDLDGDGLETIGSNTANPVLFDIAASGIKQSVGWVLPDDGFLALDRDGNGTIDSGAELFGDATTLPDGTKAEDGFAAVASLDTNGDGLVDANDAQWSDLRVWQDLNQDGVSQEEELKTMTEAGIAAIPVEKTEHLAVLNNGNALADLGSYLRTDGSEGATGTVGQLADIDLSVDTFHTQFVDSIPTTPETEALPDMGGSGQVRDLRQAASMDTDEGHALAGILTQYSAATTRSEQMALLDSLIQAWGGTSNMATTFTGAYAGHELTVDMQSWYGGSGFNEGGADYEHWAAILTTMERFNGRTYQTVPDGTDPVTVTLWHSPRDLLQLSYDALKQNVYDGLLLQTRLKPYMAVISMTVTETAIGLDFTGTEATFQERYADAPGEAVRDLLDLQRIAGNDLAAVSWDGCDQLRGWLADAATDPYLTGGRNHE